MYLCSTSLQVERNTRPVAIARRARIPAAWCSVRPRASLNKGPVQESEDTAGKASSKFNLKLANQFNCCN